MFRTRMQAFSAVLFLFICAFSVLTVYTLFSYLPKAENKSRRVPKELVNLKVNSETERLIYEEISLLPLIYRTPPVQKYENSTVSVFLKNVERYRVVEKEVETMSKIALKKLWAEANSWPSAQQLFNVTSPELWKVIVALKYRKVTKADIDTRGTQLKLLLELEGGQKCIFKPQWYPIDKVIEGPVYAGKDRYFSEVVGFYLSILLEKPLAPISVVREISLQNDVIPVATLRLLNTSFTIPGRWHNRTCLYGKCYYCKKEDPICDEEYFPVEGAAIFNIDKDFTKHRSPWQRTYKKHKMAEWETNKYYCKTVKEKLSKRRLLDLIDTAIFDFLIQNGDRHHYETFNGTVMWIDNGKGMGNPNVYHLDILAPLYQCCLMREKTFKALVRLAGGALRDYIGTFPDFSEVVTTEHLRAFEHKLLITYATIEYCKKRGLVFSLKLSAAAAEAGFKNVPETTRQVTRPKKPYIIY